MRTRFFSLRLGCRNIRRNYQTYVPFLLATSLLTFALYALSTMRFNPGILTMEVAQRTTPVMLMLGTVVVTIFTYIFLFYANSFLIKRRKTEFGLYGVLGLERRHIIKILFHELLVAYVLTLAFGMGLGTLLTRLMFLILRALIKLDIPLANTPEPIATWTTLILVSVLFLLLFLYDAVQVHRAKPIDLLHASQQGEKEPKARWLLAIIGIIALVAGYGIALTVDDPLTAIMRFFYAVLLVIIGTYLLFLTVSIALLKLLKAKKSFYYQPKHFINVSGMMYRMKQNAAGLASIAILCTMAMVTFGSTGALYLSIEDGLNRTYPTDVRVSTDMEDAFEVMLPAIERANEETGLTMSNLRIYRYYHTFVLWDQSGPHDPYTYDSADGQVAYFNIGFIPLEDFNAIEGTNLTLGDKEMAIWSVPRCQKPFEPGKPFLFNGEMWHAQALDSLATGISPGFTIDEEGLLIVLPDWDTMAEAARNYPHFHMEVPTTYDLRWCVAYDLSGSISEKAAYDSIVMGLVYDYITDTDVDRSFALSTSSRATEARNQYSFYGTLMFIGMFLGLVFLMGTALIIYFKQLSEGLQDRERFAILQKVGMDQKLVRRSVRQQVLLVFFLPLAVALCHVLGSLHLISLMIQAFELAEGGFIARCSIGSALIVAMVYLAFYGQTAHSYYKLVRLEVKT